MGEPEKEISSGTRRMVRNADLLRVLCSGERRSIVINFFSSYLEEAKIARCIHYSFR